MSLTKAQYAEGKKKIATDTREGEKIKKQMHRCLDKLVGSDLRKFQEEIGFFLKNLFTLEFQTRRHAKVTEVEIGKTIGEVESMFKATKEAIMDLQEKVEVLRWFAVCESVEAYSRKHIDSMPKEERVDLLKTFGFDPEELKREWEANQKTKKGVSAVMTA